MKRNISPLALLLGALVVLATITGAVAYTEVVDDFQLSYSGPISAPTTAPTQTTSPTQSTSPTQIDPVTVLPTKPGEPTFQTTSATFVAGKMHVVGTLSNPSNGQELSGVIELQARKTGSYFAFFTPQPTPCDPANPQNTHATFAVSPGQSVTVDLTSDISALGPGTYDFFAVSVNACCPTNPDCFPIAPFNWQTPLAQNVKYGATSNFASVACQYDYQCAEILGVPAEDSLCANAGTPESFCTPRSFDSGDAGSLSPSTNNTIKFAIITLVAIATSAGALYIARRFGWL